MIRGHTNLLSFRIDEKNIYSTAITDPYLVAPQSGGVPLVLRIDVNVATNNYFGLQRLRRWVFVYHPKTRGMKHTVIYGK